ncbi:MAG TPA: hypothetical protein VJL32_02895, partial [Candidatus Paceibacterota bacterium]
METTQLVADIGSDETVYLDYDKAGIWPIEDPFGDGTEVVGNAWIFVYRRSNWYAATWEWLRPNQTRKGVDNLMGADGSIHGELSNFQLHTGERYYMMVSTPVRNGYQPQLEERSNVSEVIVPDMSASGPAGGGGGGTAGFTGGGGSTTGTCPAGTGEMFSFFGQSKFMVFVSYFDALRATDATLDSDFAYFKSKGVSGVRIFPNWWLRAGSDTAPPGDTLMDENGELRPDVLSNLKNVLDKAQAAGLAVDVSFAREVAGLNVEQYKEGLIKSALELARYKNIIFDLQNERDLSGLSPDQFLSEAQVKDLKRAVKAVDPGRIVTVSNTETSGTSGTVRLVDSAGLDAADFHDSRVSDWYIKTGQVVTALLPTHKPVYLSEPQKYSGQTNLTTDNFLSAIKRAKRAGAAAWTLHTDSGFDLNKGTIQSQMSSVEKSVLDGLSPALATPSEQACQ